MCTIDLRRQAIRGISIAEMWVAMAVSGIILAALLGFTLYTGKSFAALTNYVDLEQKSQNALDTMTREIRQTDFLVSYGTATLNGRLITNSLTFMAPDGQQIIYSYGNRALTRTKGAEKKTLLTNCDFLSFQVFQRNPISGAYDQYPTASATNCKLVSVSWVCSRNILGSAINTESVQTAKIVIRKG